MKVSGFTVVRNAGLMGYPVVASIKSVLPLVDEFVVGLGQSEDNTQEIIESIGSPKIRVFHSHWDKNKSSGGLILSEKTNEAMDQCSHDWCFYIQADEVIHEKDVSAIRESLEKNEKDPEVEGLLFKYIHFYGSYDVIATARNWYRNEVRIVRKSSGIRSVGDAQGFRVHGRKARVRDSGGTIYHYGWVKPPALMGQKNKLLSRWWHGQKLERAFDDFQFSNFYGLKKFSETKGGRRLDGHPAVMKELVASQNWTFEPKKRITDWNLKELNHLASDVFEKVFGHRIGEYKNYKLMK